MPRHAAACRDMPPHKNFFRGTALAWLGVPTAPSPHLCQDLQRNGNTVLARDRLQCWMLREMDDNGLNILCKIVNRYMRGEHLEALAHGDLHLFPKKPPRSIRANDRPTTARSRTLSSSARLWP